MYQRVWLVTCERNGFTYKILVDATEKRLIEYMKTELPDSKRYVGATEKEIEAARDLRMPIYLY